MYENKINKIAWKADEQEYIRCVEYHAPRDWYYVSLRNTRKKIHCEEPYQTFKWF